MTREADLKRALALSPASPTAEDIERRDAAIAASIAEAEYQFALAGALEHCDLRGVPEWIIRDSGFWERFKRDLEDAVADLGPRWSLHVSALNDRKRVLDARSRLLDGSITAADAAKTLGLRRYTILLATLDDSQMTDLFGAAE